MINCGRNPKLATVRIVFNCFLAFVSPLPLISAQTPDDVPVIQITKEDSTIQFAVKASVSIEGTFDKWDATLTYPS